MQDSRADKEKAREVFEFLLPESESRRACLKFLADSIRTANSLGPDHWGISLYESFVVLNCGEIEALYVLPDNFMRIIVDAMTVPEVPSSIEISGDIGDGEGYYASVRNSMTLDFFTKDAARLLPLLQETHFNLLSKAARSKLTLGRKRSHSPGVIQFLAEHLNQPLPQPAYLNLQQEEKYQTYLQRWPDVVIFHDELETDAHDLFQRWRRDHWDNGYFINCKSSRSLILHEVSCRHPGDGQWSSADDGSSLTKFKKVCSTKTQELSLWAKQNSRATLEPCKDCKPTLVEAGPTDAGSTSAEPLGKLSEELPDIDQMLFAAFEGGTKVSIHLRRERNPKLVYKKKQELLLQTGKLRCEACGFDFKEVYGERGADFCEVHHKKPLAELTEETQINLNDLAVLCSNCHRMIHRSPLLQVDELRALLVRTHF